MVRGRQRHRAFRPLVEEADERTLDDAVGDDYRHHPIDGIRGPRDGARVESSHRGWRGIGEHPDERAGASTRDSLPAHGQGEGGVVDIDGYTEGVLGTEVDPDGDGALIDSNAANGTRL